MDNKEKKEYGGCLSVLLPLWIIGQILTIIYNLAFAGFYTDLPMIPIILLIYYPFPVSGFLLSAGYALLFLCQSTLESLSPAKNALMLSYVIDTQRSLASTDAHAR